MAAVAVVVAVATLHVLASQRQRLPRLPLRPRLLHGRPKRAHPRRHAQVPQQRHPQFQPRRRLLFDAVCDAA